MEFIRTQYERQYTLLKRRLDESETENERLTDQHRSSSKELLLYKNLLEAPDDPNSPLPSKDYHELKSTIDQVLQENQHLYTELNHFKTSDPVYEQVQLLENTNNQLTKENNRLKKLMNLDEMKYLKSNLTKTLEECEQLRSINQELRQQTLSPKQVSKIFD